MPLQPGARLGPYEILDAIGAGGMGEVYRARDARIGRHVAIKVLHTALGRFEQEVRAAGALNHPNILAIYDVGEHEGHPYLVSELLEGETLRARLRKGPLKVFAAIEYAQGIALGLAAAHAQSIIHRDLKPENIFLTRQGRPKILDFGLAKQIMPVAPGATVTIGAAPGTLPGAVMGTVGYMSPEQARGGEAGTRSDIFSFGAALYEMLAGRRAFERDAAVETLHAILKEDPPELPDKLAPALRRIVARCLEKDPERRFQSAADLAFALESMAGGAEPRATEQSRPPSRRVVLAAAASLPIAAGAFYLGTRFSRPPQSSFRRLTFRRGFVGAGRFAPDGQVIVYDAEWEGKPSQLFTTRIGAVESRPLEIPPAHLMSISRAGELAVILEKSSTLARVPLAGGAVREVMRNVETADWSPDGSAFMIVRQMGSRRRIEYPIGKTIYETANVITNARLSPDGRRVAFFEFPAEADDDVTLSVVDIAGGRRTLATHCNYALGLLWRPDGKEILFSNSPGSQVPYIQAVDLSGRVRPLLRMTLALAVNDMLPGGRVLFTGIAWRAAMPCRLRGEETDRDLAWLDFSIASDIAPDGSAVLFSETHEAAVAANQRAVAYLRKTDGSPAVRLGDARSLGLSPDGQWAAAVVPTSPRALLILPTGAGEHRTLSHEKFRYYDARWFPDGKRLLVWGNEEERLRRHYVQSAEGGPLTAVTAEGAAMEAAISPDGEFVAAHSGPGIFLFPTDGSEPQPARGDTAHVRPLAWTADGRALYIRRGDAVELLDLRSAKSDPWTELTPQDPAGVIKIDRVFLTPDGQTYVYSYERYQSDLYLAEGLA
jgi:serine/threonine protein kinase/Tol biopolymer transport system component